MSDHSSYSTFTAASVRLWRSPAKRFSVFAVSWVVAFLVLNPLRSSAAPSEVDPRGPLVVTGVSAKIVPGGVESMGYQPPSGLKKSPEFAAPWIWLDPEMESSKTPVACFRKEFSFESTPKVASIWTSADWHYRLYVNGRLVARGPADPGEDYPGGKSKGKSGIYFADYCDITSFLSKGKNSIAVEVFRDRLSAWWGSSGSRGFFLQGTVVLKDGSAVGIQTDSGWRVQAGKYLEEIKGGMKYSPVKEPEGWRLAGFDDSSWKASVTVTNQWPKLLPSELVQPMETVYPVQEVIHSSAGLSIPKHPFEKESGIVFNADGEFTLKYNRVLPAYAGLKIRGTAGALVTVDFAEREGSFRHAATLELKEGVQYFETPYYTSFAFMRVRASGVKGPVEIQDVRAIFTSQPVDYKGSFSCSDEVMNRLWIASRWATQICMQDRYLDSPDHQEPICDPGDYLIESLLNYQTFLEPALTRQDLRKLGYLLANNDYINFHTSYSLLWLQMLLDYYDHTGDASTVRELAPQVHGLLDKFAGWRGKNGLISEAPDYMFMDWVSIGGFGTHHPPAVIGQGYLTAFYYRGLLDGKRVAELTGDNALAQRYEQKRLDVSAAYNRELWNPEKQLYRDGKPFQTSVKPSSWLPVDKEIETFSTQNNTLAVLYDLAPKTVQTEVMKRLMAGDLNCQPYFMHFVLGALGHAGLFDAEGTRQMRRWRLDPVTQTSSEMWGGGDLSHGWGGTPLYQMGSRILGVAPTAPGFSQVLIRPTLCDLAWAKGNVPTPYGLVMVSWKLTAAGLELEVRIPKGIEAEVQLPIEKFVDPVVHFKGQELTDGRVSRLAGGHYWFQLRGKLVKTGK